MQQNLDQLGIPAQKKIVVPILRGPGKKHQQYSQLEQHEHDDHAQESVPHVRSANKIFRVKEIIRPKFQ